MPARDVRRLNGHKDGEGEGGQHTKDESDGVESSGGLGVPKAMVAKQVEKAPYTPRGQMAQKWHVQSVRMGAPWIG
jgi:hypothetical protein